MCHHILVEAGYFAHRGNRIFFRRWPVARPREKVVLLHGFGAHGGYYEEAGAYLSSQGTEVHTIDLPGFGNSRDSQPDMMLFQEVLTAYGNHLGKYYVAGSSLGALVALEHSLLNRSIRGVVGIGTPFRFRESSWLKVIGLRILSLFMPRYRLKVVREMKHVQGAVTMRYFRDPMTVYDAPAKFLEQVVDSLERVARDAARIMSPVLLVHGIRDPVVDPKGTKQFFERLRVPKKMILYDAGHILVDDVPVRRLAGEMLRWTRRRSFIY